jgi:hypothetical protein
VNSISAARLRATARESATAGVEQNRPSVMPDTANVARVDPMARSHWATSWQPAAVAIPSTSAMTYWGRRTSFSIRSLQLRKRRATSRASG